VKRAEDYVQFERFLAETPSATLKKNRIWCLNQPFKIRAIRLLPTSASPTVLAGKLDLRMNNTEMPGKGIIPREQFFLRAECTLELKFADVVYGILVTREIIWP